VPLREMPWTESGGGGRTVLRTLLAAAARRAMESNQFNGTLPSELDALTALRLL
jgi:hypothetical protein